MHLVSSPLMLSLLAKLGNPKTHQPQINELTEMLYAYLMDNVIDLLFPRKLVAIETRMKSSHPEAVYEEKLSIRKFLVFRWISPEREPFLPISAITNSII